METHNTIPIKFEEVIEAFFKVRSKNGTHGVDSITFHEIDGNPRKHLYPLWVKLTSGNYYPNSIRQVKIPKKDGGMRVLGIPTIIDRVAQQVIKAGLEETAYCMFSKNSFAYIPKRTVQQAIHQCWANCNKYNWVVDIDIKGFFDNIDHNLMIFALKQFTDKEYILIYVQRWVKAKYSYGLLKSNSGKGIPQGAVISPLLANIFLHVVFDKWFEDMYPQNKFERYADDIIIHCDQYNEAKHLFKAVKHRMKAFKLRLNEQKSKIVYCLGNQLQHPFFNPSYQNFNFLGYTFKTIITNKDNKTKLAFMPIINQKKNTGKENIPKRFNIHQKLRFSFRKTIKYSYYKIKGRIIFLYKYLRFKIRKLIRQLSYRIIFRLLNQNFRYHM